MNTKKKIGKIMWVDLTVPDAEGIRDFYADVVGWGASGVDMGGYEDFNMAMPGEETPQVGICHQRGQNADLPAIWMVYIEVEDLDKSLEKVEALGGTVLVAQKGMESSAYAIIQDPAGAVCALIENQ